MLNLLKFKEKAEYEDDRETDLTGAEAYAIYGTEVVGHLAKTGPQAWRVSSTSNWSSQWVPG